MAVTAVVDLGPAICSSLPASAEREWLVTNGIGGYASGTVSGILTRRYHGLLMGALDPPGGRTLLVSKVDEIVSYDGARYELGANRWADGSISPTGFRYLTRFHLQGTTPVWTFACADAVIEKRVWMQQGENTAFVSYSLLRSTAPAADLDVKVLANCRGLHNTTRAGYWMAESAPVERGLRVALHPTGVEAIPVFLLSETGIAEPRREWYQNFELSEEGARGLDDRDDHFFAGVFRARLEAGKPLVLAFSTDAQALAHSRKPADARAALDEKLLEYWVAANPQAALDAPPWVRQLVLAAEQFTVSRARVSEPKPPASGASAALATVGDAGSLKASAIIAGYPWFGEWSRDTMIALPGLTLQTGRGDVARAILRAAAYSLDQGMLPNVFPEARPPEGSGGEPSAKDSPQYNSVDATLWYFEALRQYDDATSDKGLIGELYDQLDEILECHVRGTRYGIAMDSADGLLRAGEPGVQLTWMDAKVGDRVITARIGKPIEVNALWYNALRTMSRFAFELSKPPKKYIQMAERTLTGFTRFWNAEAGYCFDVLDGPGGNDATLRPNQIFAVSLPESPLNPVQRRAVVEVCARRLLTPMGLRTLAPGDRRYRGIYTGPPAERDAAYHQGTAWAWLMGPFILAHLRTYNDPPKAASFFEPVAQSLDAYGLGTINEICDGDAPFQPRGAIAQAWSVGEVLRAWHAWYEASSTLRRAAAKR